MRVFNTHGLYSKNILVSLNTLIPNQFVEYLLEKKKLIFLNNYYINKKEIKYGNHRFDFLLREKNKNLFLEVKSVSLKEGSIAKFPDSITDRGRKHIKILEKRV